MNAAVWIVVLGTGCTAVTIAFALHYWQGKRYRIALYWAIAFALSLAGAVFFTLRSVNPAQTIIQSAQPEKQSVFTGASEIDLLPDKAPVVKITFQNGRGETTLVLSNISFVFTY